MEAVEEKEVKEKQEKPQKPQQKNIFVFPRDQGLIEDHFVTLKGGLKGFLVSTDQGRDAQSVRETLDLFANFADKYYPKDGSKKETAPAFGSIEDSLKAELQSLKTHEHRRFFKISTDTKGSYFLRIADDSIEPVSFLSKLFDTTVRLSRKGNQAHVMRFTSRILPIEITGQASQEEIMRMAQKVIPKALHPPNKPCKFKIELRKRLNDKLARDPLTAALVRYIASGNKVDLKKPDKTVIVEIIKGAACLSVFEEKDFPHGFNIRLAPQSKAPLLFDKEDSSEDNSPSKATQGTDEKDEKEENRGLKRLRDEKAEEADEDDMEDEEPQEEEPKKKKKKKEDNKKEEEPKEAEPSKPVHIKGGEDSEEEEFRLL